MCVLYCRWFIPDEDMWLEEMRIHDQRRLTKKKKGM